MRREKLSNFFLWTKAVWITARGDPLDFETRKYLIQIYQDQHPSIVFMKASQMGISERLISEAVWIAEQKGLIVLYCFPTQIHLQDFVQARLNPVLTSSEYLRARIGEGEEKKVEKLGLKRIGNGYIYFRGSQNEKQIVTVDADCIILDERDRFIQENVPFIDKRLLASKLKWRREASTPTLPGVGIHKAYLESDQRVWQVCCRHCNEWQELDFFKNIDFKTKKIRCIKCKKIIDRFQNGRWFITNPESKIHGYKINGIYNPTVTIEDLIAKYKEAKISGFSALQQFFNQNLGVPYEVTGQRIQVSELDACKRDYMIPVDKAKNAYAGVDVGIKYHHVIVAEKLRSGMRLIWIGRVSKFFGPINSLEAIMNKYKIKIMVIDRKPETSKVIELMEKFPGRVYSVEYPPNVKYSTEEYFKWDDVKYQLKLDRTISLDYLISDIQNQKIELPKNIGPESDFYKQLGSAIRIVDKEGTKGETAKWIEKGDDHYLHALNFVRMAQLRGREEKALLDYYTQPLEITSPDFLDWLRIKGERIF